MTWETLDQYEPWMQTAAGLAALVLLAYALRLVVRMALLQIVPRFRSSLGAAWLRTLLDNRILVRVAQIVPSLVVQTGIAAVPHLPVIASTVIRNVAIAVTALQVARLLCAIMDGIQQANESQLESAQSTRSVKSYVQLGKMLVMVVAGIVMVATLIDRSPLILLSGLGAMSAVLMLVFKDTILSFTAGVQLSSNDILRVGDWLEMNQVGADGAVVDMALNTVKVRNWDNTITTIPTWRLMSDSFKNWRGMSQSGVRRIRRALRIDADTIRVLDATQLEQLSHIALLKDYLAEKRAQTAALPASAMAQSAPFHPLQLTNLELLRAYAYAYLNVHPGIQHDTYLLARTLEPTTEGVPLELYCYTSTSVWVEYENIQGSIFDHLIGVLPEFGLRLYQRPSGSDVLSGLRPLAQGSLGPREAQN